MMILELVQWRTLSPLFLIAGWVMGCAQSPNSDLSWEDSPGHLTSPQLPISTIPKPVKHVPLPPPDLLDTAETYTVMVNGVPIKELLFALSRDAAVNVDVHTDVQGTVTMNAVDQTLEQILDRISHQVAVRIQRRGKTLVIRADKPFLKTYQVDYVNLSRRTKSQVSVATQVATTGGTAISGNLGSSGVSENQSTTNLQTTSNNLFWETLIETVQQILSEGAERQRAPELPKNLGSLEISSEDQRSSFAHSQVIANRETGVLVVKATSYQHKTVQAYIEQVLASARRQVLIEVTIVEVQLNERHRSGINFQSLLGSSVIQKNLLGPSLSTPPFFLLELADAPIGSAGRDIAVTLRLLKEFGDVHVLSTPTIMALNNQTAIFKVVENRVFFTTETQTAQSDSSTLVTFETTPYTVPVGLVMAVTPQIDANAKIILNVRPTITRTIGNGIRDPNPNLQIDSRIPEIAVRELESVLRLHSGQIAVMGGLMEDETSHDRSSVPGLSATSGLGRFFRSRDDRRRKRELVVFLRPTLVDHPDIETDLRHYRRFLSQNTPSPKGEAVE